MLPDPKDDPSGSPKPSGLPLVTCLVLRQLGQPVARIRFRVSRVPWTAVPETPVDQDSYVGVRKGDIDGHAFDTTVEPEPEARRVQGGTESSLRSGILALHPAHDLGTGERGPSRLVGVLLYDDVPVQFDHLDCRFDKT